MGKSKILREISSGGNLDVCMQEMQEMFPQGRIGF